MSIKTPKNPKDKGTESHQDQNFIAEAAIVDSSYINNKFLIFALLATFITVALISSNPILYFLATIILSLIIYLISRFIGFFIKRNPDYYNDIDYNEEDE
ncbi:MAG: hypothetical protein K0R02_1076 [Rickettsiaceae bacterium]|jgi:hypothetical protein|nr:hypothetical protein [Rickettsiaceae bacterium]